MEVRIFGALLETTDDANSALDINRGRISVSAAGDKYVSIECEGTFNDKLTLPIELSDIPDITLSLETPEISLWADLSYAQARQMVSVIIDVFISYEENSNKKELEEMKVKLLTALQQIQPIPDE